MKEKELQSSIIELLETLGYLVIKQQSGAIFNPKRGYIPMRRRGIPDLLFCDKQGHFGAIEVKVKPNKATQEQLDFLADVKQRNGTAILAYDIDEVIRELKLKELN